MEKQPLLTIERQGELIAINRVLACLVVVLAFASAYLLALQEQWFRSRNPSPQVSISQSSQTTQGIAVDAPEKSGLASLLKKARYQRTIDGKVVPKEALIQLLFAAQGKITSWGERTVPSYKSGFPVSLTVTVKNVAGVDPGNYRFDPIQQLLVPMDGVLPFTFPGAIAGFDEAPLIITATTSLQLEHDGMMWNEAGGIAQNILLAASELNLITFLVPSSNPTDTVVWYMPVSYNKEAK